MKNPPPKCFEFYNGEITTNNKSKSVIRMDISIKYGI